tara:strand:+ start:490719 stop:490940 length:222 start_codon:yes stop_codon:yes gene_type:complete
MAFYKTTTADHKPSIGVLADLIRKHGAHSGEVEAYMTRFQDDTSFCKRANLLIGAGGIVDVIAEGTSDAQDEE